MVDELKRKKFVDWMLSLHTTKFYEAKINSFFMYKLLIKMNIVQTQVWEKPIYKLLCFRKQRVYERNLYHGEMNYFDTFKTLFSERNSEPIESAKIIHFAQHFTPCTCSYTWTIYYQFKKYVVSFNMQRWTGDTDCSFTVKS